MSKLFLSTLSLLPFALRTLALNPSCAPGGNFDLSIWSLQLPTGSTGSPTTISSSQLESCSGYQDSGHQYFFTESGDGALVMKVPGSPSSSGCVTTPNSLHCRTELRESNPSSWDPNAVTNRMTVSLAVKTPDNSGSGTVIGQVHIDDSVSSKPVCEIYYNSAGDIQVGVEQTQSGGNEILTKVGNIAVGTTFTYELSYQSNVLSISINGGAAKTLSTYSLDAPPSYFKVGNYNQGSSASDVHFFSITVEH
ncbi:polysaccharide lyase family 7 protein [Rhizodiscina lignyota]|uniref:Polysaccharide lyase family 7 protein n=1 Tax=Rhizodiscina lignyota TaxID=1504668 RepID=A0A9P4I1Y8_9PEZI|nr:polysaccharide lyase family 7 protein [Rhizodiscina lignyota]